MLLGMVTFLMADLPSKALSPIFVTGQLLMIFGITISLSVPLYPVIVTCPFVIVYDHPSSVVAAKVGIATIPAINIKVITPRIKTKDKNFFN